MGFSAVWLGLASAACWGAADFCGGLATKRTQVYRVIISSQTVSLALLLALAVVTREAPLPIDGWLWGGVAGIFGAIGLIALYRALADGHMGIAAPVSAVVAAAVPVIAGAFIEGLPGAPQLIGFGLAFVAVWLISRTGHTKVQGSELGLPVLAGLGFGIFFVIIGGVGESAVWWPLVAARIGSLGMLLGMTWIKRQVHAATRPLFAIAVIIGALEVGGNAGYLLARQVGRLDVAAVLASLYPAATVLLARFVLKERFGRSQLVGIVAALIAIALIAV